MHDSPEGRSAELVVEQLATSAGFVVNRGHHDHAGWDLMVEWSTREALIAAPFDAAPTMPPFKIQVKALVSPKKRFAAIKLDNWKRHSEEALPHFIAAVVYANGVPSALFLRHVDEPLVVAAQKRLFLATKSDTPFHRQSMRVRFRDEDRIALTASAFKDVVASAIGDARSYAERKRDWAERAGYGKRPYRVRFTLPAGGDHPDEPMVDFAVGIVKELVPEQIKLERVRFGVATDEDDGAAVGATITAEPLSIDGVVLTIAANDGSASHSLAGKLFSSRFMLPMLPREVHKTRFVSEHLEVLLGFTRAHLSYRFPEDAPIELRHAGPAAMLLRTLRRAPCTARLRLKDGTLVQEWQYDAPSPLGEDDVAVIEQLDDAWWVVQRLAEGDSRLRTTMTVLAIESTRYKMVRSWLGGTLDEVTLHGELDLGERIAVVMPVTLSFIDCAVTLLLEVSGTAEPRADGGNRIAHAVGGIHDRWMWSKEAGPPDWRRAYDERLAELTAEGVRAVGSED